MLRRPFTSLILLFVLLQFTSLFPFLTPSAHGEKRPNFLIIITDDQRYDELELAMPKLHSRIKKEGTFFSRAYVTTPMCCPSRASIFTGKYASHHKVLTNDVPLRERTLIHHLHRAGYRTGLIGKYLNSWLGEKREEFDYWVSFRKGVSPYYNPRLNIQGEWREEKGYITYLLEERVIEFLNETKKEAPDKPFILFFTPNAPHQPLKAAPGDEELFNDLAPHRPPNFNVLSDTKPPALSRGGTLKEEQIKNIDLFRKEQHRACRAVDRSIERILDELDRLKLADDTVVIFTSDNGALWGEFGLQKKVSPYEPSVHVPMYVRYPKLIKKSGKNTALIANIDIAPTIYDLSDTEQPEKLDGLSLLPLLTGEKKRIREYIFLESTRVSSNRRPFTAIHTGRKVFVRNRGALYELYDLSIDPFQLKNLAAEKRHKKEVEEFKEIMKARKNP